MGGGASQPTTEREELAFLGGSDDANNKDDSDHHSEGHRHGEVLHARAKGLSRHGLPLAAVELVP